MNLVTAKIGVYSFMRHLERISELFLAQTGKRTLYPYAAAVFFVPALANTDYCRVNKSFILFNVTCC